MTTVQGAPRAQETVFEIGDRRWALVEDPGEIVSGLPTGVRRSWQQEPIPLQNANDDTEFELALRDFSRGAGFSFAATDGVYESADQWDASAPGVLRTLPLYTVGASTESVDARGFLAQVGSYLYLLRGRYASKYLCALTPGTDWPVIERFDFGALDTSAVVAGRPALFGGDLYVPLRNSTGALKWVRLSSVNSYAVETQTLTISGSPATGTWTATFQGNTSDTIAVGATAATVEAALQDLPGLQDVTVARTGSSPNYVYTVTMTGVGAAVGTSSPPAFTVADTFDTGSVAVATTDAGTADQWDRGPVDEEALTFATWQHPVSGPVLVRANSNVVALCATAPLTAANWGSEYEVGDSGADINALAVYDRDLVVGKGDGRFYTFDGQGHAVQVPDVAGVGSADEWVNMQVWLGYLYAPTLVGLWRWRPGAARKVGAEQDGQLDGSRAEGWGPYRGFAPHGDRLYYVAQDDQHEFGALGFFAPVPRSALNPVTPHQLILHGSKPVEDVAVLTLSEQPGVAREFNSAADDSGAGTLAWSNPTFALSGDVGANLVPNPGAESDTTGWSGGHGATLTRDTTEHQTGSASFKVVTPGDAAGEGMNTTPFSGDIPVVGGVKYYLACLFKSPSGSSDMRLKVDWYTASGGTFISAGSGTITGSGDWKLVAGFFTAPANATVGVLSLSTVTAEALTFHTDGWCFEAGTFASASASSVTTTHYLKVLNPNGTIPSSATITGIQLDVRRRAVDIDADAASIVDDTARLLKAGVAVGDDKASATAWGTEFEWVSYGGPTSLWGTTWTAADFNATFGALVSAVITQGQAQIDALRVTVYYSVSGAGAGTQLLAVLTTDGDRTSAEPRVYQLPHAGLAHAQDPSILHATSEAELRTARYTQPGLEIQKTYRCVELYLEADPETNTPGVEVWASVDGGDEFQLQTNAEADSPSGATLRTTGFHRVFFPVDARAVGRYVQLRLKIPAVAGSEDALDATLRDVTLRGSYRVDNGLQHTVVVRLRSGLRFRDGGLERRSAAQQRADLISLNGREVAPVAFRVGDGTSGYCEVVSAQLQEVNFKGQRESEWVGVIRFREAPYGDG